MKPRIVAPSIALLLLGAGGQALAAAAAPAAASAVAATTLPSPPTRPKSDPNEVICKRQDVTGSRLGGASVCHTRQEWADMAAASRTRTDAIEQQNNLTRNLTH